MSLSEYTSKSRKYLKTHPWITFVIDLERAGADFWITLGEVVSKIEHIAGVPLKPDTAMVLHTLYLAKGIQATTAIEGNTLPEEQVQEKLKGELALPPSQEYLGQEVENMANAYRSIAKSVVQHKANPISFQAISDFNIQVLNKLPLKDNVIPGKISERPVTVANYIGTPREDCRYLLDYFCDWLTGKELNQTKLPKIALATIKGIIAHLYIAWIHPFGDGNGRTARLVEFQILAEAGIPTPAIHLLANHYNQTRTEYYRLLNDSSKNGGNVLPFLQYALTGFRDGLIAQLKFIRTQQWNTAWENYVHERFKGKNSKAQTRQKELLLDLPFIGCAQNKIPELTPRLASSYAKTGPMTVYRDVTALAEMELVEIDTTGPEKVIRPKREIILAFLPPRKHQD